ncbi:MAG TPA: hypothetical protein VGE36_16855 [Roseateles sp.]
MNRRPLIIFALLLSMLLQTASLGGHWAGMAGAVDTLHAVLHWAGLSHHHEHGVAQATQADHSADSGSAAFDAEWAAAAPSAHTDFHQDFSADSNRHMGLDACVGAVGPIPASLNGVFVMAAGAAPALLPQAEPADPFLAGLRRPPKHLA